jgi:Holliday junction resolvase RusA-like endonuclease
MKSYTILVEARGAPRMSRNSHWKNKDGTFKQPGIQKWFETASTMRLQVTGDNVAKIPLVDQEQVVGIAATVFLPVKESWPDKKKRELYGRLHVGTPDTDNILKGICDALFDEDKQIAIMLCIKRYCEIGKVPCIKLDLIEKNDIDNDGLQIIIRNYFPTPSSYVSPEQTDGRAGNSQQENNILGEGANEDIRDERPAGPHGNNSGSTEAVGYAHGV